MADVDPKTWNAILDRALESRAVFSVMGADVLPSLRADMALLEGLSWRGERGESVPRYVYLLSMVAFTKEPFSFEFVLGPVGAWWSRPRVRFYAEAGDDFVVGAIGPISRDNGRGIRETVKEALRELEAS